MAAKQTLPEQHLLLEQRWPGDCCLCHHEAENAALRTQLEEAQAERDATIERGVGLWRELAEVLEEESDWIGYFDKAEARIAALEEAQTEVERLREALDLARRRIHQYRSHVRPFSMCDQYPCAAILRGGGKETSRT